VPAGYAEPLDLPRRPNGSTYGQDQARLGTFEAELGVLKKDRSLVFFPILSTLFAALAAIAIWAPTLLARGVFGGHQVDNHDPVYYIAGAATAYVSTFISIFVNVALAVCAVRSMRGEDTRVAEGINAAARRRGGSSRASGSVGPS
jgi:hypothetical protein